MRLDREQLDMIATARLFVDVDLLPADVDDNGPVFAGAGDCRQTDACMCRACYEAKYGHMHDDEARDDGDLILAAIIGASQAVIIALLAIIDSDDEARLAQIREIPAEAGTTADVDETLFAAWADTKEMLRHWEGKARARELELRAEMGEAQTGLVNGAPAIVRITRTEQVRAHPRRVDYLRIIRPNGIAP